MTDEKGGGMNEAKLGKLRELDVLLQKMSAEHHKHKKAKPEEESPEHETGESAPEETAEHAGEEPAEEPDEVDESHPLAMMMKPKREREMMVMPEKKPGKPMPHTMPHNRPAKK